MNKELLQDMFYAAPELWYIVGLVIVLASYFAINNGIKLLNLRKELFYTKRDKERFVETLYASKDGYFAFVYLDETKENVIEHCSRRLAVILNLPNGINSSINEILKCFYKDDAEKISKYINLLREDGVSFEDQFLSKSGKRLSLNGVRISGNDGSIYSDTIWVRDISSTAECINRLIHEKDIFQSNLRHLEDLIDNLPYPVWIRNHSLNLITINKKYVEFLGSSDKETIIINNIEIPSVKEDTKPKELAKLSQDTNRVQKQNIYIDKNGERLCFEAIETPFLSEDSLDRIATVGTLIDITPLDNIKRNVKQYQSAHLEILGALGTAFAVFDSNYKLEFYNLAFQKVWNIEESWLDKQPIYGAFLDYLREKRLLPEVPDYPYYKLEEHKMFSSLMVAKEDLLHLPDGRSLRRIRAPLPKGGLIFAFEDISDRLAIRQELGMAMSAQQEILNNIEEAVLIFASTGRLKFYNQAYVKLWDADEIMLQKEPTISDLLDSNRHYFENFGNWEELKKDIISHIFSNNTQRFIIHRDDGSEIDCSSSLLSNESIMVLMKKLSS